MKQQMIFDHMEKRFGVTKKQLLGKSRRAEIVKYRHVAMYLMREDCTMTFTEIGMIFQKDHSTIVHAHDKIKKLVLTGDLETVLHTGRSDQKKYIGGALDEGLKIFKYRLTEAFIKDPFGMMVELNTIVDRRLNRKD